MRVLWFTNAPPLPVTQKLKIPNLLYETWVNGLRVAIKGCPNLDLGIASAFAMNYESFEEDGVVFYNIPSPPDSGTFDAVYRRWMRMDEPPKGLSSILEIINDFRPDIIHIHGSEKFFGSVIPKTAIPTVMSIQGILSVCETFYYGGLSFREKLEINLTKNFLKGDAEFHSLIGMKKSARRERSFFQNCKNFIGRTEFDRNFTTLINPDSKYFHCDEILRTPFYKANWDNRSLDQHIIYCTMNAAPYKGLPCLLRACSVLKLNGFPDIQLRIGGQIRNRNIWGIIKRKVEELDLKNNVTFLDALAAEDIVSELEKSSIFILPSYIDNSSNSLSEAMLVGVPCIASYAGGSPSLIQHGMDGLLFPPGDSYSLAGMIARLFREPTLAKTLSINARNTAQKRHDPQKIAANMKRIYSAIIYDPLGKEWANREQIEV